MDTYPDRPMGSEPPEIGDRVRAAEAVVAAALGAFEVQEWVQARRDPLETGW